jgi:2'-5' RNA ligase
MIFPKFKNMEIINKIRDKYDPAAKFVEPHVTLVFPFESDIETDVLKEHVRTAIKGIKPFKMSLKGITSKESFDNYIFVEVANGSHEIIKLYKNLYTGILEKHHPNWLHNTKFVAHMTVGKLATKEEVFTALKDLAHIDTSFKTTIDEIAVEIIDIDSSSIIEFTEKLL